MQGWILQVIQCIAYAVAKGCTEAYLDAIKERSTATEEKPNDTDAANADRMRRAILRLRASGDNPAGSVDPAPGRARDHPGDLGATP